MSLVLFQNMRPRDNHASICDFFEYTSPLKRGGCDNDCARTAGHCSDNGNDRSAGVLLRQELADEGALLQARKYKGTEDWGAELGVM